jgi:hypothetical protein
MKAMEEFVYQVYVYCTDFIINLANLCGLSYYEINLFMFCILYPILLLGSCTLFIFQRYRHSRYTRKAHG